MTYRTDRIDALAFGAILAALITSITLLTLTMARLDETRATLAQCQTETSK